MNISYTRLLSLAAFALLAAHPVHAQIETYTIDPSHSSIGFKVRHFFTMVPGTFDKFGGFIKVDRDDPSNNSLEAKISVASIDTNSIKRDKHMQTDDYFNSANDPFILYKSTSWEKVGENKFKVTGDLTMLGKTHEVILDVDLLGFAQVRGKSLSGWHASATIDRNKWGIISGKPAVGDEVDIDINIEAMAR